METKLDPSHITKAIADLEKRMFEENLYYSDNTELQHEIAMRLLRIVVSIGMGRGDKMLRLFYDAEKMLDVHILPCSQNYSYKSPIPKISELSDKLWEKQFTAGIDWNEKEGLELINKLAEYSDEYTELVNSGKFDQTQGQFWNHDAAIYYCMIRHFSPKHIFEIGAGGSTRLSYLAKNKTKHTTITSIDPCYESGLNDLHEVIRKPVQDIPIAEITNNLGENDILFIDGSHVTKIGSDVNYLFLEVLPLLKDGVIVHVHDIFLPDEIPKEWIKSNVIFWNEQYLLNAFLIFNSKFKVLLSNNYMQAFHPEALLKIYNHKPGGGGSLWMKKIKKNPWKLFKNYR